MENEQLRRDLRDQSRESQLHNSSYTAIISSDHKKESPGLESLLKIFNDLPEFENLDDQLGYTLMCVDKLKQAKYDIKDAVDMCESFTPCKNNNGFGVFASASIFSSMKEGSQITIKPKCTIPFFLSGEQYADKAIKRRKVGFRKIKVDGNVGDYSLSYACDLKATITGSAGDHVGYEMKYGDLEIEGDAGNYLGENAKGGNIHVNGKAGIETGRNIERPYPRLGVFIYCEKGTVSIGENAHLIFVGKKYIHDTLFNLAHAYDHFRKYGPGNKYLNLAAYSLFAIDAVVLASHFLGMGGGYTARALNAIADMSMFQVFFCFGPVAHQLNRLFGWMINKREKRHEAQLYKILYY